MNKNTPAMAAINKCAPLLKREVAGLFFMLCLLKSIMGTAIQQNFCDD
jgi:hypothetical protein